MSNTVEISLEAVLDTANMERAWAGVKANAGSGGVDGKGIAETEAHLKRQSRVSHMAAPAGSPATRPVRWLRASA